MFKDYTDYCHQRDRIDDLETEGFHIQLACDSIERDEFYARRRANLEAMEQRHQSEAQRFEQQHPNAGFLKPGASYRIAVRLIDLEYRQALEAAELERKWALQMAADELVRDRRHQARWAEAQATLARMQEEWERQEVQARAWCNQQHWYRPQQDQSPPAAAQPSKRKLTDAERKAYRSFHLSFHPDRHQGSSYCSKLAELVREANAVCADRPNDLLVQDQETVSGMAKRGSG